MSVERILTRPKGVRSVPLLTEPEIGHYPEFREFFHQTFDLDGDPLGKTGLVTVEDRLYEFIFLGRSEASTLDLIYFCEISREGSNLYQINDFGKSEAQFVN